MQQRNNTMSKSSRAKSTRRNNRVRPSTIPRDNISVFSSNGAIGKTSQTGNRFNNLSLDGNPFDASQDGAWVIDFSSIKVGDYFLDDLTVLWEYYRVKNVETTFYWKSAPKYGPVMGSLYFLCDKDSRESYSEANGNKLMNRRELKVRQFSNDHLQHTITWKPYLVENHNTYGQDGEQVDYVQPRERWLNTRYIKDHRFGTLRYVVTTPDVNAQYASTSPAVGIRHRVTLELKGLETMQ